jgi:GNAT superfamily N-acetyltransferase
VAVAATAYEEWVERVESAVADEEALTGFAIEVERAADLDERERADVAGRIDRFLENFDDRREALLIDAVDRALAGPLVDDAIPDFDLSYGEEGAEIEEAVYQEHLHPRDRVGRWRDAPDLPKLPEIADLFKPGALRRLYDGFEHNDMRARVLGSESSDGARGVYGVIEHDPDDGGDPVTVGTFENSIFRDADGLGVLYRDLIEIHPEFQGRGFSTALNVYEEKVARRAGIDRIELSASLAAGGYTWARAGFDFKRGESSAWAVWDFYGLPTVDEYGEPYDEARLLKQVGEERVKYLRALAKRVGEEEWAKFAARFPSFVEVTKGPMPEDRFTQPWEIANYGREEGTRWEQDGRPMWLGKAFMLGAGWEGVKHLQTHVQEAATQDALYRLCAVAEEWRANGWIHDAPDSIEGDRDEEFWRVAYRTALG